MQQVNARLTGRRQYHFGAYRLDPGERRLWRDGKPVTLTSKVFDVLAVLVANSGRPMSKDEIMQQVWPDSIVEEGNLARNVSTLRRILGDRPEDSRYVTTLPGRGYQFVHPVQEVLEGSFGPSDPAPGVSGVTVGEKAAAGRWDAPTTLRTWVVAAVLVSAGAGIGVWRILDSGTRLSDPTSFDRSTLAVLPFISLNPATGDEHLGIGMADTLITRLGGLRRLIVRPTGSVLKYQSPDRDLQEVGRQLRVEMVMDGSLRRIGDRIRVTVRLVRVEDGSSIWTDTIDEAWSDLLKVEDEIAKHTVTALALKLTGEEKRTLEARQTRNLEAFNLYARARHLWNRRTSQDLQRAVEYFEKAIVEDPNYTLAHVGLADTHMFQALFGFTPPAESYAKAKAAVARALDLDDRMGEAHVTLGHIKALYDWDRHAAEMEYRRAIELSPNYPLARQLYAIFLATAGREREAMVEIELALELDPVSPSISGMKGALFYWFRRNDRAIRQLLDSIELEPHFWLSHFWLALVYADERRDEEALEAARKAVELSGGTNSWILGYVQGVCGRRSEAQQTLESLIAQSRQRYVPPYDIAMVQLGLGRNNEALDWLARAYEGRSRWMDSIGVLPAFDPLRRHPRFQDLLRRLDLPH